MSGGAFNYAYRRIETFREDLLEWLNEFPEESPEVRQRVLTLLEETDRVSQQMHAIEWYASGDFGLSTFIQEYDQLETRRV